MYSGHWRKQVSLRTLQLEAIVTELPIYALMIAEAMNIPKETQREIKYGVGCMTAARLVFPK